MYVNYDVILNGFGEEKVAGRVERIYSALVTVCGR